MRSVESIPVVCRQCGKQGGFSKAGEVEIRADVWKPASIAWSPTENALTVKLGPLESDIDSWGVEDAFEEAALDEFHCSHCGLATKTLEELVVPKYGVDRWDRVLDERGEPLGPMVVHPDQMKLGTEVRR